MSIFNQLKQQLSEQPTENKTHFGLIEYQASVPFPEENVALLNWLKAQEHYPHFFGKLATLIRPLPVSEPLNRFPALKKRSNL
ncbi:menaquinone-specific isochorismate synthase [Actinobacillus equuli]|nr:menaquinone-specific isochorismate synthase [Actinobacillus equuli]